MHAPSIDDLTRHNEPTALICASDPAVQKQAADQAAAAGYKVHTGLFAEDIALKLKAQAYDVVVVDENFDDSILGANPALAAVIEVLPAQRRRQFVVLVGPNLTTNNAMQAFAHSVDDVCSLADLPNLKPVIRRGAVRQKEFFTPFWQAQKAVETIA